MWSDVLKACAMCVSLACPDAPVRRSTPLCFWDAAAETVVVEQANGTLQPKQRIRSHTSGRKPDFPRTGTGKVQTIGVRDKRHSAAGRQSGATGTGGRRGPAFGHRRAVCRCRSGEPQRCDNTRGRSRPWQPRSCRADHLCRGRSGRLARRGVFDHSTIADLRKASRRPGRHRAVWSRHDRRSRMRPRCAAVNTASNVTAHVRVSATQGLADESARWRGTLRMPRWAVRFPAHQIRRLIEEGLLVPLVNFYSKPTIVGLHHVEVCSAAGAGGVQSSQPSRCVSGEDVCSA